MSKQQVHSKFKVFMTSSQVPHHQHGPNVHWPAFDDLKAKLTTFLGSNPVAAKSVGILESQGKLVLTLGYRDDEPAYPVQFTEFHLGRLDLNDATPESIEHKLASATKSKEVICHELVIHNGEVFMAVLERQ